MLLIVRNCIFAKTLMFMIETFSQISAVVQKLNNKPMDIVASYLAITEILKILSDNKIIHYTSYLHLQWRCDFKVMCSTLTDVSKGTMIEIIAQDYNRSVPAVQKVVYNLGKQK